MLQEHQGAPPANVEHQPQLLFEQVGAVLKGGFVIGVGVSVAFTLLMNRHHPRSR
ncbi:MAG: hypothetical protein ACREOD_05205 [Candidatus Dormibacteria bacterium]